MKKVISKVISLNLYKDKKIIGETVKDLSSIIESNSKIFFTCDDCLEKFNWNAIGITDTEHGNICNDIGNDCHSAAKYD